MTKPDLTAQGGSYTRTKSGKLKQMSGTEPSPGRNKPKPASDETSKTEDE